MRKEECNQNQNISAQNSWQSRPNFTENLPIIYENLLMTSVGSHSYLDCDQSYLDWASLAHVSQSSEFSCAQSYLELSTLFAKLVGQA